MKQIIFILMMLVLPAGIMAQVDDLYYVPTKKKAKKEYQDEEIKFMFGAYFIMLLAITQILTPIIAFASRDKNSAVASSNILPAQTNDNSTVAAPCEKELLEKELLQLQAQVKQIEKEEAKRKLELERAEKEKLENEKLMKACEDLRFSRENIKIFPLQPEQY